MQACKGYGIKLGMASLVLAGSLSYFALGTIPLATAISVPPKYKTLLSGLIGLTTSYLVASSATRKCIRQSRLQDAEQ
jgi:hypothetical protein